MNPSGARTPLASRRAASAAPAEEKSSTTDSDYIFKLYLKDVGEVPLLSTKQTHELTRLVQQGDKRARETMILANLRLVVKIAHDYEGLGLPLLDVIQEGNNGLMKAVERFDPEKGSKFSTYASLWIKQSIKRALANTSKTIRKPIHVVEKLGRLKRTEDELKTVLERQPSGVELSEAMGLPIGKINQLRAFAVNVISLDAPVAQESDSMSRSETVADKAAPDPSSLMQNRDLKLNMETLIKDLPERELTILRYRFGLSGCPSLTLEQVGRRLGITRERVRQIQNNTLAKLRRMLEKMETVQKPA